MLCLVDSGLKTGPSSSCWGSVGLVRLLACIKEATSWVTHGLGVARKMEAEVLCLGGWVHCLDTGIVASGGPVAWKDGAFDVLVAEPSIRVSKCLLIELGSVANNWETPYEE